MCLNYGPLQNWELLLYYGFCELKNVCDTLTLEVGEHEDEGMVELMSNFNIPSDHILEWIDESWGKRREDNKKRMDLEQAMKSMSTKEGEEIEWPLSKKLLMHIRILNGISCENLNNFSTDEVHTGNQHDVEICETVLDVLGQLLIPSEEELEEEIFSQNPDVKLWDEHDVYGPLARKFRESQRLLVKSNIAAVEKYQKHMKQLIESYLISMKQNSSSTNKRRRKRG